MKLAESDVEFVRLSLTHSTHEEQSRVLSVHPEDKEKMEEAERLLIEAFEKSRINGNLNLRLATLANLSLKLLAQTDKT